MSLACDALSVRFGTLRALDGVSLRLEPGRTLGLVGESGSGKSTLGRALVHLLPLGGGRITLDGVDATAPKRAASRAYRQRVQIVFQDPSAALDPLMSVRRAIGQGLRLAGNRDPQALPRLLEMVGLSQALADRLPHELSGGQRQRVAIARSLAVNPQYLVLDEVTSALDVSVQAMVLNLLRDLQRELGLAYLFISHNMAAVKAVSDDVAVMYLGRIVEHRPAAEFFAAPAHPYARALLDAVPRLTGRMDFAAATLLGEPPDPRDPPSGCRFHTRCPVGPLHRSDRALCRTDPPEGLVACHFPLTTKDPE
ncbi:oligopeptide/dipeptide ABC transporter ATP-binding protein [Pararhodobacter sp.]|uniref:oligopeptide/dipeptide ABC transporter ATP-binding protein n=1 Tax=Pararhodobacter sp. TaxID=2127056 RepID=UPI002B0002A4|nr:oligopeptide/dipeptide ABC transporter ATP-binding protein [Pararhodobacter sp.]